MSEGSPCVGFGHLRRLCERRAHPEGFQVKHERLACGCHSVVLVRVSLSLSLFSVLPHCSPLAEA